MKSKNCCVPIAFLVASFFLISCSQPTEPSVENTSVSEFSQDDQNFCKEFLEQIKPATQNEDALTLRSIAATHWVLVDDEKLMMSLRDLHNMNFDTYITFDDGETFGITSAVTGGRSQFRIGQEYSLKRSSIVNRCLKITDDPRLEILGSAK
jgi:hypothetical protein